MERDQKAKTYHEQQVKNKNKFFIDMFIKKEGQDIEIEYGGKDHDNQGFKTTFSIKNKNDP